MKMEFVSPAGIRVERYKQQLEYQPRLEKLAESLDKERGVCLSSGVDFPNRYSQWEIGFKNPPLEFIGRGRDLQVSALNQRGVILLSLFRDVLASDEAVSIAAEDERYIKLEIVRAHRLFAEEERSLQPSLVTPLRSLIAEFAGIEDDVLGLYGAFGYDLIFQFEPIGLKHARGPDAKDLHLFFPDEIYLVDRRREITHRVDYIFSRDGCTTAGRDHHPFSPLVDSTDERFPDVSEVESNHDRDSFTELVDSARDRMRAGDVYELVLHRRFSVPARTRPSLVAAEMRRLNPSPYEFFCQFGNEQLVGTSPEMFVRVTGDRIESCPISGTVRSYGNAMEDADAVRHLLNSEKDEVELTMCTDVDRNDKARICLPGSVRLLERRLVERYAGLYHTVDHVEGRLRPGMTGLDAFLSHMWAVTLTGSPKPMAAKLIEQMEGEPRQWYGGAVGTLKLNGDVSTGITIRTVHLKDHMCHYRTGATLVYDSVGAEEEQETRTKATAFFQMLERHSRGIETSERSGRGPQRARLGEGRCILLIDNQDSFVNILADYFRQTRAEVHTYRSGLSLEFIHSLNPDLVVHSPGPGWPKDFGVPALVSALADAGIPQFGICLGMQGIVEAFGGKLEVLDEPRQGKTWSLFHDGTGLFEGVSVGCTVGAYHAIQAMDEAIPSCLHVLARSEQGGVMAVSHADKPIWGVQFHPESILSMRGEAGRRIIDNVMKLLSEFDGG